MGLWPTHIGGTQGPSVRRSSTETVSEATALAQKMHATGEYTISDLGELFSVSRPTVYRTIACTNS